MEIEYAFKDVRMVGACCTIIAQYFKDFGIVPDSHTATALLFGIKMDTNPSDGKLPVRIPLGINDHKIHFI